MLINNIKWWEPEPESKPRQLTANEAVLMVSAGAMFTGEYSFMSAGSGLFGLLKFYESICWFDVVFVRTPRSVPMIAEEYLCFQRGQCVAVIDYCEMIGEVIYTPRHIKGNDLQGKFVRAFKAEMGL